MKKVHKLFIFIGLGLISLVLFWRIGSAFAQGSLNADFNGDSHVNLIDFEIWRQNRYPAAPTATGQPTANPTIPGQPTATPIVPEQPSATPTPTTAPLDPTPSTYCRGLDGGCRNYPCCPGLYCKQINSGDTTIYRCKPLPTNTP